MLWIVNPPNVFVVVLATTDPPALAIVTSADSTGWPFVLSVTTPVTSTFAAGEGSGRPEGRGDGNPTRNHQAGKKEGVEQVPANHQKPR